MSRLLSFFSSKPAPHKQRTHAEVFDELISSLCEQGNHDLHKPLALGSQNLLDDLKEIYHQLALQCFESTFGYPYSKESFDEAEDMSATTKDHEDVAHEPEPELRSLLVTDTHKTLTKAISDLQKHLSNLPSWSIGKWLHPFSPRNSIFNLLTQIKPKWPLCTK
ncbi:hypothetical protein BJ165DRAFT_134131 [Panaeolus papilionaceus]|nr:hypothetical protein BJ165DRAFT_134131 [Panaeolus papilionaceus]